MIIHAFWNVAAITTPRTVIDGCLGIELRGVTDGTEITLKRADGQYSVKAVSNGFVSFDGDIIREGADYTISFQSNLGEQVYVGFCILQGAVVRKYCSISSELTKIWDAVIRLADENHKLNKKIASLTDGYQTE